MSRETKTNQNGVINKLKVQKKKKHKGNRQENHKRKKEGRH